MHVCDDINCNIKLEKLMVQKKINSMMTARREEMEILKNGFDYVLEGHCSLSVITGAAGVGKTFLVENVVKELAANHVTYIYGKFRQYDNKPFVAVSEVIESMVKNLLTLPNKELDSVRKDLIKVLGSDINIITSINPYSKKLLGEHPNVSIEDYDRLKYRVKKTLYRFLSIVSEALFPLIVFVDDLQWADTPSLEAIEGVLKGFEELNLMVIYAHRDNNSKHHKKNK